MVQRLLLQLEGQEGTARYSKVQQGTGRYRRTAELLGTDLQVQPHQLQSEQLQGASYAGDGSDLKQQ